MLNHMEKEYCSTRVELSNFLEDIILETKLRIQDMNEEVLFQGDVNDFYIDALHIFKKEVYSVFIKNNTLVVIVIDGL